MGLSVGLDTAVKALRAHQLAVDVASHNIANAQTPGFSRQRVLLRPIGVDGSDHFSRDALLGKAGYGVEARDVNRVRDIFLDFQVRQAMAAKSENSSLSEALTQAEVVFNDPTDDGLGALIGKFWAAWHDVVTQPESAAARTTLVHSTSTLATRIQRAYQDISQQRTDLNRTVESIAGKINTRATEIAQLNFQIKQVELNGDMANDLRDRRDLLLDELSSIAQISYTEQPDRSVTIYIGSHELVVANEARQVKAIPDIANPGFEKLVFVADGANVQADAGELKGVLDARDVALPALLTKLDTFALGLITDVNALHSTGYGLDGTTTGLNFFAGTGANDIAINGVLAAQPDKIAAASAPVPPALTAAPGDGSNALAIADLQHAQSLALGNQTFDDYYTNLVSVLGADVKSAKGLADSNDMMAAHLDGLRLSISGVNLDEEMTNLNASQHAYEAAARVITSIDEMLDTLINRTGLAGR